MELVKFNAAKHAIAVASSVDEVKDIRDKAQAMAAYCRQAGESLEMQNRCAEIKLQAERKAGQMLAKMPKRKRNSNCCSLQQLGIERTQSHRWQKIAKIGDREFEKFIRETVESRKELTTAGALRLAKTLANGHRNGKAAAADQQVGERLANLDGEKFATIYADPPWAYGNQGTRAATDNHYPTMKVEEICSLPVAEITEDESLLFLWTTNGFLVEALTEVIPAWGFTYKSCMVWVKPQMGIGNYVRVSHEFLLIANRGKLRPEGQRQKSWVEAPREKHSRKPEIFRSIIETIAPGPRLEMFAREEHRGWHCWGNEVPA